MIPKKIFFTKGVGRHRDKLRSFELALRDAGIAPYNLVNVSSILPPNCKIVNRERGVSELKPGQILFVVLARNDTNEANRLAAASIGCAIPADSNEHGYLAEHHSFGQTDEVAGEYAEDLAAAMLSSTLGIEFDEDADYDELREMWKFSDKIVKTTNITQSAIGRDEIWTSVIAAAVMYQFDENLQQIAKTNEQQKNEK